jgi:predicted heme/steroid binding protein
MNARLLKTIALGTTLLVTLATSLGCGASSGTTDTEGDSPTSGQAQGRTFTLEELAEFDGEEGRPAYVAVDGVVYDVTASSAWSRGMHSQCGLGASAGRDLSDVISQAPSSMRALLQRMPVMGSLVE